MTGGYADSSGFGVVLGAGASWFYGAEVVEKVWIDFYETNVLLKFLLSIK